MKSSWLGVAAGSIYVRLQAAFICNMQKYGTPAS
jgi:hypothetical protein